MPITQADSLMSIATNSSISVHERIKLIKGKDKIINSTEEAQAIIAISSKEVKWYENKEELPFAKFDAENFIKYGNKNLRDDLTDAYRYCKQKGKQLYTTVIEYINLLRNSYIAKSQK